MKLSPHSLLSLSLCILELAREIERVKEIKESNNNVFGQLTGVRPIEGDARPVQHLSAVQIFNWRDPLGGLRDPSSCKCQNRLKFTPTLFKLANSIEVGSLHVVLLVNGGCGSSCLCLYLQRCK